MKKNITTLNEAYRLSWLSSERDERVVLVLDVDDTLLFHATDKYSGASALTDASTPGELAHLTAHPSCHVVILTARAEKYHAQTVSQLKQLGIRYHTLIHAPNIESESTKGPALRDYLLGDGAKAWDDDSKMVVVDDLERNLLNIEESLTGPEFSGLQCCYLRYDPDLRISLVEDAPCAADFPPNLNGYADPVSLGGGSNSVYQVTREDGHQLVIKHGDSPEAIQLEIMMNALYRVLSVDVPESVVYRAIPVELAKAIHLPATAVTIQCSEKLTPLQQTSDADVSAAFCKSFVVQCLLGNTDSAKNDNWVVTDQGAVLVDSGANYLYWALGGKKDETVAWQVRELDSFRDKAVNAISAEWLEGISQEQINEQAIAVLVKSEAINDLIWTYSKRLGLSAEMQLSLIELMANRLENLALRTVGVDYIKPPHYRAVAEYTSAGVLTVRESDGGELQVFLGKRVRHPWYACLGGKSDREDKTLAQTASREVSEESSSQLHYTERQLSHSPFHDIWTQVSPGQLKLYRLYVVYNKSLKLDVDAITDTEHTDFCWVPLTAFIEAVEQEQTVEEEGRSTLYVETGSAADSARLPLMPEFAVLIQQASVQDLLRKLLETKQCPWLHGCQSQAGLLRPAGLQPKHVLPYVLQPAQLRIEAAAYLVRRSLILQALKKKQQRLGLRWAESAPAVCEDFVSQSELHLCAVLGENYKPKSLRDNIESFLDAQHADLLEADRDHLFKITLQMIEQERRYPDRIFIYHSCPAAIAYAYEVYSEIYQILYADSDRFAMRVENDLFRQLLTIDEFLAHFINLSGSRFDNYVPGYMELAISANLFVFGKHDTPTSYSIGYMMNNESRSVIDTEAMLNEMLSNFNCDPSLIVGINAAIARFVALSNQGVIHQFSLSKEEAGQYAYSAESMGVLNPHPGLDTLNPATTINYLRDQHAKGELERDCKYLVDLQVRVMLPTTLAVRDMRVISWRKQPDSCRSIKAEIQMLCRQAAESILRLDGSGMHGVTVLGKQQQWMFPLVRPCDQRKKNVFNELKVLVENKEYEKLREQVKTCPWDVRYDVFIMGNSYSSRHETGRGESLLLLLLESELSDELKAVVKELYGDRFYLDERNASVLRQVDYEDVCRYISQESDRLDFALSKFSRISNKRLFFSIFNELLMQDRPDGALLSYLCGYMANLPAKERKIAISQVIDTLKRHRMQQLMQREGAELLFVIECLYDKDRALSLVERFGREMVSRRYITEFYLRQDLTGIRYINTYVFYLKSFLDGRVEDEEIFNYLSRFANSYMCNPGFAASGICALSEVLTQLRRYKKPLLLQLQMLSCWSEISQSTLFFRNYGRGILAKYLGHMRTHFGDKFWDNPAAFQIIKTVSLSYLFESVDPKHYVELLACYLKNKVPKDFVSISSVLYCLRKFKCRYEGLYEIFIANKYLVDKNNYCEIIGVLKKHESPERVLDFIGFCLDFIMQAEYPGEAFRHRIQSLYAETSIHARLERLIVEVSNRFPFKCKWRRIYHYKSIINNMKRHKIRTDSLLPQIRAIWEESGLTLELRYRLLSMYVKCGFSREQIAGLMNGCDELVNPGEELLTELMADFSTSKLALPWDPNYSISTYEFRVEDGFRGLLYMTETGRVLPRYCQQSRLRLGYFLKFTSRPAVVFKDEFLYRIKEKKMDPEKVLSIALDIYIQALMAQIPLKDRKNGFKLNLFYRKILLQVKAIRAHKNYIKYGVSLTRPQLALLQQGMLAEMLMGWDQACYQLNKEELSKAAENRGGGGAAAPAPAVGV